MFCFNFKHLLRTAKLQYFIKKPWWSVLKNTYSAPITTCVLRERLLPSACENYDYYRWNNEQNAR